MKVLFLSRWFPYPYDNGSKIRVYHLIKALSKAHSVDLISFSGEAVTPEQKRKLLAFCRTVDTVIYQSFNPTRLKGVLGFFSRQPRSLIDTFNPEMASLIDRKVRAEAYDAVIASEIDMVPYAYRVSGPVKIFEEMEISKALDALQAGHSRWAHWRNALTWFKLSRYLNSLAQSFDGFTTVSQKECQNLEQIPSLLGKVQVVPNGMEIHPQAPGPGISPKPGTLVYAGSLTYQANFDAVDYFLQDIFPLIQKKYPGVKFYVTGKLDGVDLTHLSRSEDVIFTGYLPDVSKTIAESWLSVVPLRIGGGTRLKVLESLSLGTPVVSTSKGVEGLDLEPGCDFLIGDDPQAFADQVFKVLEDEELRRRLGQMGRQSVAQKYNWNDIEAEFCSYVEAIVSRRAIH